MATGSGAKGFRELRREISQRGQRSGLSNFQRSLFLIGTPDISAISSANFPVNSDIIGPGSYFSQTYTSFPGSSRGSNTNSLTPLEWSKRALVSVVELPVLLLLGAQLPSISDKTKYWFQAVVSNNVLQRQPKNR